jgi:hypothetical protein
LAPSTSPCWSWPSSLCFGADNDIRVACRTHLDSRWYAGCRIHRDMHLVVKEQAHLDVDGVRVTTPEVDDELAGVEIAARVANSGPVTALRRPRSP